jgi:ribokinase
MMNHKPKVIALGNINADFQVRAENWPGFGEELFGRHLLLAGGGKAGNAACIAQRLGAATLLVGRVGADRLAEQALAQLRKEGVDLRFTRTAAAANTGTAFIATRNDGGRAILIVSGANERWSDLDAADAVSAVARLPAGSVLVANLGVPGFVVERAARAARMRGFSVVLDPAPPQTLPDAFYNKVDFIMPNQREAGALTGVRIEREENAIEAAQALLGRGVKTALVRLANGGCIFATREELVSLPPVDVEIIDKTGGGDAFAGALAVALLEGREPLAAAQFAMAAAHVAVTRYGAQPSFPNRTELDAMLAQLQRAMPKRINKRSSHN